MAPQFHPQTYPLALSHSSGFTTTGGTLSVNVIVSNLRPDMVIHNEQDDSIHLIELTVQFETNILARKETTYLVIWNHQPPGSCEIHRQLMS